MNIKKIAYAVLALAVLASGAHAEPVAPCVRQIALVQSRIYACQRILNNHARNMVVIMRKSVDAHGPFRVFGNNENKELCGSIRFEISQFDKTNVGSADAVLVLQNLVLDAFKGTHTARATTFLLGRSAFKALVRTAL